MKTKRLQPGLLLIGASGLAAILFLLMALTAYSRYTTLGIDSDVDDAPFVYYRYYRIRWPGDGSFRIGDGAFRYGRNPHKPLEPFDLGGRFFKPSHHELPQSVWNRAGFWFKSDTWDDERTKTDASAAKPWEAWVGVPCWLPVILFALPPLLFLRQRRKKNELAKKVNLP